MEDVGKIAYDAWNAAWRKLTANEAGLSTAGVDREWKDIPERSKLAWRESAKAAREHKCQKT